MPPKRSNSSKAVPMSSGGPPIQTTTNTTAKLEMPNAGSATEANINVAGGNTKSSPVTVLEHRTPEKSRSDFQPGTTPVKFYNDELQQPQRQRQKNSLQKPVKKGFSLRGLAVQVTLLYALVAYFFICPNDPSRTPAVCKSYVDLQNYREQALSYVRPYYQPYIDQAQETISPYYTPYATAAKPHYDRVQRTVTPQVAKAHSAYNTAVKPRLLNAFTHSQRRAQPHLDRVTGEYGRRVTPHVHRYSKLITEIYELNVKPTYDEIVKEVNKIVSPLYQKASTHLQPALSKAYPVTQHHLKHTFLPFATSSISTSQRAYNEQVHPRLVSTWRYSLHTVRQSIFPAIGRFQSRYISPQLNKIQDRAFAYKAKSVASEKVASMDRELGKDIIDDEIEELLSGIKAETSTHATTILASTTTDIRPTAVDTVEFSDRDDVLAQKLLVQESLKRQQLEKRKAVEALHDLYEVEVKKLGETESTLLADRLSQLRRAALRDIPNRFDIAVQGYKEECDKWVGRLDKYWEKANRDERSSKEDKMADGVLIARKASVKLADQAEELEDEVDAYLRTHNVREMSSTEKAFKTVENFVGKAQEELGNSYAYLDDVTHLDWQRFHTLAALEGQWHHSLFGMRNGSVSHSSLDQTLSVESVLAKIKLDLERISADAEARLASSRSVGERKINGQFISVADSAQQGYAAVRDAVIAGQEKIVNLASDASQAVAGEPTPTDVSGTLSSIYTAAASSASSVYFDGAQSASSLASGASASAESLLSIATEGATAAASSVSALLVPDSIKRALDNANAGVQSGYADASRSLYSLAGLQPSPTNIQESAGSLLAQATGYLAGAQDAANVLFSSYASEASKTAMSLAGQTPTPTNVQGSASSALSEASASAAAYADQVASQISSAAANAQGVFAKIAGDAYAVLPTIPGTTDLSTLWDVSATFSSQVHQATRQAAKAVGLSVTPESVQEHAESLYSQASEVAASLSLSAAAAIPTVPAADSILAAASSSIHEATRAAIRAVGATPSPEQPNEYLESAYNRVGSMASAIVSSASDLVPTITVPGASGISSNLHQATRSAVSALGVQPSAEGLVETASSVYAQASSSAASLMSQASSGVHEATRDAIRAVGATPTAEGVVEQARSVASSVSQSVSSAAESLRQRVEL